MSLMKCRFDYFSGGILFFFAFGFLFSIPANGQSELLSNGIGARSLALGGGSAAYPVDATAQYWNPAGLDLVERNHVSVFLTRFHENSILSSAGLTFQTRSKGTFGINYLNFSVNGIQRRQNDGTTNGFMNFYDRMLLIGYGKNISKNMSIGFNFKIRQQVFTGIFSSNYAPGADMGFIYRPHLKNLIFQHISVGLMIWNIVPPKIKFHSINKLPRVLRIGLLKQFKFSQHEINCLADLNFQKNESHRFHLGLEYSYREWLHIRLGDNQGGANLGIGMQFKSLILDYWCGQFSSNSEQFFNGIALNYSWGKTKHEKKLQAKKRFDQTVSEIL